MTEILLTCNFTGACRVEFYMHVVVDIQCEAINARTLLGVSVLLSGTRN